MCVCMRVCVCISQAFSTIAEKSIQQQFLAVVAKVKLYREKGICACFVKTFVNEVFLCYSCVAFISFHNSNNFGSKKA